MSPLRYSVLSPLRSGDHGYLVFEDPDSQANEQFVDGPALGRVLVETGVGVLVLNACRSAHADLATTPDDVAAGPSDVHTRVRAYGSLAQEVVDAGVAGVVAMRYNVWVVTAAQFIGDLYASLLQGEPLGEAVTAGRKQLAAQPAREIAFTPRPLQDWMVPVIYEAAPVKLFTKPKGRRRPTITISQATAADQAGQFDSRLPARPDVGFLGRDETLLALDRAFDTQRVVLLHALAGAGKTTTAAEFARWYALTGGVQGPVLFTSFERHLPLTRVLDQLGEAFEPVLEENDIHWLALTEQQRRQLAGWLLEQVPVLWIWDNVEPVPGFPAGTESQWSKEEQEELVGFLRHIQETQAKVLLTSRRDEYGWLGELPGRVSLPPMPMTERVQLARAIAVKQGRRLSQVEDWRPLLAYTQGNPLTVTVLVGQALREGTRSREEVEAFVARLQAGEATLADDEREGRTKSLGASLGYGFEQAFSEAERAQLAVLHLFQGFVDVDALRVMGDPELVDEPLAAVRGLTREAGMELLDRAAEVGLLTSYGGGYYRIHPALPWYFQSLFTQAYGSAGSPAALTATRAYTSAIGSLGSYYHGKYNTEALVEVVEVLEAEEANLLHARRLALLHGWLSQVIDAMQGLRTLYGHAGRNLEWVRLVNELVPYFVDPATDGPRPGFEDFWGLITEYRTRIARDQHDYATAERLLRAAVTWDRKRAAAALATPPEALDAKQRSRIRALTVRLQGLGTVLLDQQNPECVEVLKEVLELGQRIGAREVEDVAAFNLGSAYLTDVPSLRDLAAAEQWYQHDLRVIDEHDKLGRARTIGQLGSVHIERYLEARDAGRPSKEIVDHMNAALKAYLEALDLIPEKSIDDLATVHMQLGNIYDDAGEFDTAMSHYRDAIRYREAAGRPFEAGRVRINVALILSKRERYGDALLWAQAALRDFQPYGQRAADEVAQIQQMIADFEQNLAGGQG
jgi:tetratricopeptide (TPR) repeat protein